MSDYDYFSMAGDQEPESQQVDFDKSSTIPRNSDISQSYRLMFQSKRPASTAGLPSTQAPYPAQGYSTGPYPSTPIHTGACPPTPTGNYVVHSLVHLTLTSSHNVITLARLKCPITRFY